MFSLRTPILFILFFLLFQVSIRATLNTCSNSYITPPRPPNDNPVSSTGSSGPPLPPLIVPSSCNDSTYYKPYSIQANEAFTINTTYPYNLFNSPQGVYICNSVYIDEFTGNDNNNGTKGSPVKTLWKGQDLWRASLMNGSLQNILIVFNGSFYLNQTAWELDQFDSAQGHNFTIFTSLLQQKQAQIHGGALLPKNWTLYDEGLNIWQLYVGPNFNARSIWLNNTRIATATTNHSDTFGNYPSLGGESSLVYCGGCNLPTITEPIAAEVFFLQYFQFWICQAIVYPDLTMNISESCFVNTGNSEWTTVEWLANMLPLLVQENSWVNPINEEYIYYIPSYQDRNNVNNLDIVAPYLTTMMRMDTVSNMAFFNLTFATTTWNQANTENGVGILQADYQWNTTLDNLQFNTPWLDTYDAFFQYVFDTNLLFVPPAMLCQFCNNTIFAFSNLINFGTTGLYLGAGTTNALFWMNNINDVSGSGIRIGTLLLNNTALYTSHITVQDNDITEIGVEYRDAVGIFHLWSNYSNINHNTVYNLPYTGISMGLGWEFYEGNNNNNNNVTYNNVYNTTFLLNDGANLYINANGNFSIVSANYLHDSFVAYYGIDSIGLYCDQGCDGYTFTNDNVIDSDINALHFNYALDQNYFCCNATEGNENIPSSFEPVLITGVEDGNPTFYPFNINTTVQNLIMNRAGSRLPTSIGTAPIDIYIWG
jgi:hypothetical protein